MRFLPAGPSIPDELLIARDEGRVVFFCGAGVSRARAGLPDFFGLAQAVADKLGVAPDSPARALISAAQAFSPIAGMGSLVSADRVFSLIEREFRIGFAQNLPPRRFIIAPNNFGWAERDGKTYNECAFEMQKPFFSNTCLAAAKKASRRAARRLLGGMQDDRAK